MITANQEASDMQAKELIDLANTICRQKSEGQTVEVKAAHKGCPQKLYDIPSRPFGKPC